jgi:hypothetical protein
MFKFFINEIGIVRWLSALLLLLPFIWLPCKVQPLKLDGQWYEVLPYSHCTESATLQCTG